jgi:heme-degrading monooxygenase HmoA
MIARNVSMHLKPNRVVEFTRTMDREVIPLLRKLKGFQDEITFVASGGLEALGISLWDQREDAEAYNRGTDPKVLKALAEVVEGTPRVEIYQVANSTFHVLAASTAA